MGEITDKEKLCCGLRIALKNLEAVQKMEDRRAIRYWEALVIELRENLEEIDQKEKEKAL